MTTLDNALGLLVYVAAGVFAIRGWLISQPNLTTRSRDRFYATGLAMVGLLIFSWRYFDQHRWFLGGCTILAALSFMARSEKWYRLWDTGRQSDRRVAAAAARLKGRQ